MIYDLINLKFPQLFSAAANVLQRIGEDGRVIQEFVELGHKAKVAASEAMDAEATLGEIPDEFLDPIQVKSNLSFSYSDFCWNQLAKYFFCLRIYIYTCNLYWMPLFICKRSGRC